MFLHMACAVALAATLLPTTRVAAASLSLDQALDLAVQRSQLTRSARAGAASAAEIARAAGQQPDPMLVAAIDNLPATGSQALSTSAEDMTMKRIGISQEWVSADKRAAREAAAGAAQRRESAMERIAAGDVRLQTASAYIDAYYAGQALKLAMRDDTHAREALEVGKARLAGLSGNGAELLAQASELGAAEDELADQRQQQGTAAAALHRWIGVSPDELAEPHLASLPSQDDYVAAHPDVIARQRDIDVARQELEIARLNRRPNWRYELSYGQRVGRPDLVSFAVSIPLTIAPAARQDRETAARLALVDQAEAALAEARRAAAGEYAALANDAQRLQERIERFRPAVLVPLEQRVAVMLAAYRSNQASLAMWFDARHAEVQAQRKLLSLQRDLARARARLVFKPLVQGESR
jgi:cobalt-zinc-cadmium efflux system outer membrane protein